MPQQMSKSDAGRIQSTQATGGKATGSASFASRAQSAGDKNTNVGSGGAGGGGGNSSGDRIGKDSGGGGKGSTGVSK